MLLYRYARVPIHNNVDINIARGDAIVHNKRAPLQLPGEICNYIIIRDRVLHVHNICIFLSSRGKCQQSIYLCIYNIYVKGVSVWNYAHYLYVGI